MDTIDLPNITGDCGFGPTPHKGGKDTRLLLTDNFWGIIPKGSAREERLADNMPVRRIGVPEDVTRAVMFFADPAASFVTGQVLFVCGGASLGGISL